MSDAIALDPMPDDVRKAAQALVLAVRVGCDGMATWLTTQSTGPDKRRLDALVGVLRRDVLLLEQILIKS